MIDKNARKRKEPKTGEEEEVRVMRGRDASGLIFKIGHDARAIKKLLAWAEDDPHFFEFDETYIDNEIPEFAVKNPRAEAET